MRPDEANLRTGAMVRFERCPCHVAAILHPGALFADPDGSCFWLAISCAVNLPPTVRGLVGAPETKTAGTGFDFCCVGLVI